MNSVTRLTAAVNHQDTELGVFNPLVVFSRLEHAFPSAERFGSDHLEDVCVSIIELSKNEGSGAVRTALRDLIDRGPALRFRIPRGDGKFYIGIVDRQKVTVSSVEPFEDEFREDFERFLTTLEFPRVCVTS